MKLSFRQLPTLLAPAVVLFLLAVQIAFGLRGFELPRQGAAVALEVPGLLIGWGSVAFLLPLLLWLVLDWWGSSVGGLALKLLGAAALGLSVGALCGLAGGVPAGGHVGQRLASLLTESIGPLLGVLVLVAMAVPGLVLSLAGLRTAPATGTPAPKPARASKPPVPKRREAPAKERATAAKKDAGGLAAVLRFFRRRRKITNFADLVRDARPPKPSTGEAWYPETQYDENGVEIPMVFGGARDVGEIRYAEQELEEARAREAEEARDAAAEALPTVPEPQDEEEEALPTIPELFSGDYDGDLDDGTLEDGPESSELAPTGDAPERGAPQTGAAVAASVSVPEEPAPASAASAGVAEDAWDGEDPFDVETERPLLPGVRYAEPGPAASVDEAEPDEVTERAPAVSQEGLYAQMRVRAPDEPSAAASHDSVSMRDAVMNALHSRERDSSSQRYLEKLEASGIFDFVEAPPAGAQAKSRAASRGTQRKPTKGSAKQPKARTPSAAKAGKKSAKKAAPKATARSKAKGAKAAARSKAKGAQAARASTKSSSGNAKSARGRSPSKARTKKAAARKTTARKKGARGKSAAQGRKPAARKPEAAARGGADARRRGDTPKAGTNGASSNGAGSHGAGSNGAGSNGVGSNGAGANRVGRGAANGRGHATPRARTDGEWRLGTWRMSHKPGQASHGRTGGAPEQDRPQRDGGSQAAVARNGSAPLADEPEAAVATLEVATRQVATPQPVATLSPDVRRSLRRERADPLFARAAEIALERGAASPVLLTRRLGIGFTRARDLVARLVASSVLDEMSPNGSHKTRLTQEAWEQLY